MAEATDSPDIKDWDDAYANGAHIPGAAGFPPRWDAMAAAYRSGGARTDLDVAYGDHTRQRMDVFWPEGTPKGLAVFVHGGYWLKFDKSTWSHLAEGACALGWAVALPSYVLAPEARISEMTEMVGVAVEKAAQMVDGPIRLAGHSAGGHLVSRMACLNGPLSAATASRVDRVLSISGLHDLRPLLKTAMNDGLGMDNAEATAESAALCAPNSTIETIAWVGADERPEFIRQTKLLETAWRGNAPVSVVIEPGLHHFDVIEGLSDQFSPISKAFAG